MSALPFIDLYVLTLIHECKRGSQRTILMEVRDLKIGEMFKPARISIPMLSGQTCALHKLALREMEDLTFAIVA